MLKQILLIIILSIGAIILKLPLHYLLNGFLHFYTQLVKLIGIIFLNSLPEKPIQGVLALLIIPFFIGLFISAVFWLMKRRPLRQFMILIWIVWLILLVTLVTQNATAASMFFIDHTFFMR